MTHSRRVFPPIVAVAFCFLFAIPAAAQTVVVLNDFEDGTLAGLGPARRRCRPHQHRGGRARGPAASARAASGRRIAPPASTVRASRRLGLLTKGATYQVTVWARLVAGQAPAQLRVTMQRTVSAPPTASTPSRRAPRTA